MRASARLSGLRVVRLPDEDVQLFSPVYAAAREFGVPVFLTFVRDTAAAGEIARTYDDVTFVIDQLGLTQPPARPESPPFRELPDVLRLAESPNVMVKVSGAPTLSAEGYPFNDLWVHLRQLIDAFGPQRLMWGSDISRIIGKVGFRQMFDPEKMATYGAYHSYAESLMYLKTSDRLTSEERDLILGGTARRLLAGQLG
jgi:hypothetical protein